MGKKQHSKKFPNVCPVIFFFLTFGLNRYNSFIAMASNFQYSSSDTTDSDVECTQNKKELLDYVLEKYRQAVFEQFNIIASKLDQINRKEGYGEKIIKECLEEFNRVIEERQKK